MPTAGAGVSGVEEVLRARANARRIKEHYEGTLGVPSELQSLSHFLAHDKDGVFAGLENLPFYSKSSIPAPPAPAVPAPPQPPQPVATRRRAPGLPTPVMPRSSFDAAPSPLGAPALMPPHPLELDPWDPDPASPGPAPAPLDQQQQQGHQAAATAPAPLEQPAYPMEPRAGPSSPGRVRLPSGLTLDPWRWAPSDDLGPVLEAAAAASGSSEAALQQHSATDPRVIAPLHRPNSRASFAASAASSRQASPTARGPSGAFAYLGQGMAGAGSGGSGTGSPVGSGVLEAETEEECKHRMARQRLLSAKDLSPQDWARMGPPQDAADLEKFTARGYALSVDFDRQTLMPQRVARPDIFHISSDEAQRRQMESHEAALALQAQRRAEAEAEEQAAEAERLARSAQRGPRYDALGVRQVDGSSSPVRPRYLDWHPGSVGGLQQPPTGPQSSAGRPQSSSSQQSPGRRSFSGGSGGCYNAFGVSTSSSRCVSAVRPRAQSAAAVYGTCGAGNAAQMRQTEPPMGSDPYVYEDLGGDDAGADNELGVSAAYGTHPPRRRHHSAIAGSFTPPLRPNGVTDAHFAQMVRQQRKWLNAPALPLRPLSAAPFPAPMSLQYVRPRSSRPPPEGTAAPVPSRAAAEAAALAAAAEAAIRPNSALRTVIHQRPQQLPPRPPGRGRTHATWAPGATSAASSSRPASAATSAASFAGGNLRRPPAAAGAAQGVRQQDGQSPSSRPVSAQASDVAGGGGAAAASASAMTSRNNAKKLPWEAREHVAAAAAVGIIPPRLSWDALDVPPAATTAAAAATTAANRRGSSTGLSGTSAGARSRTGSSSARRQQQQQGRQQQGQQGAVFGETLVPEAAGKEGGEQYVPRKFELRGGMVLDGYMGR